jgi:riboflavin kinase / FMN adenylyltransferase
VKLIQSVKERTIHPGPTVVTIGNFDGLHLGHRALMRRLMDISKLMNAEPVVFTFVPHPKQVLFPGKHFVRLFDFLDQKEQLTQMGISMLVAEPFSRELSETKPEKFLQEYVVAPFHPKAIVVGHDFSFGHNRSGNAEEMRTVLSPLGVEVFVQPAFKVDGEVVSSSRIRQLLSTGKVKEAQILLGRPFYLRGLVTRGTGRGSKALVPTANIEVESIQAVPQQGVYATRSHVRGQTYASVTNIGKNPTFEVSEKMRIETHLLDFRQDIYGDSLQVEFLERIREERKFPNVEALMAQINEDIKIRRTHFP